jgi:hypothetical protein
MADPLAALTFRTRKDDWSYQVTCDERPNFWFRLKSERDEEDVITDFLLNPRGVFPDDLELRPLGGALLTRCYRELQLRPHPRLVFGNILVSKNPSKLSAALSAAQALYTDCARKLFADFGLRMSGSAVERRTVDKGGLHHRTEKYDLLVSATSP